jgi:hypothetical protein
MVNAQSSAGALRVLVLVYRKTIALTFAPPVVTPAGLISLLSDSDPEIQSYAIEELNEVVPMFWAEISEVVAEMCVDWLVCVTDVNADRKRHITAKHCLNRRQPYHLNLAKWRHCCVPRYTSTLVTWRRPSIWH